MCNQIMLIFTVIAILRKNLKEFIIVQKFNFVIIKVMHFHSNFYGRAVSHFNFITRGEFEKICL